MGVELADSILEKLAAEATEIRELRRRLQQAEQDRTEALLAWQSLCELVGQSHFEVEQVSEMPIQATVTVKFHLSAGLVMRQGRRRELIDHIGKAVADALLVRLVAADPGVDDFEGRRLLRSIPPPPYMRHLPGPKW